MIAGCKTNRTHIFSSIRSLKGPWQNNPKALPRPRILPLPGLANTEEVPSSAQLQLFWPQITATFWVSSIPKSTPKTGHVCRLNLLNMDVTWCNHIETWWIFLIGPGNPYMFPPLLWIKIWTSHWRIWSHVSRRSAKSGLTLRFTIRKAFRAWLVAYFITLPSYTCWTYEEIWMADVIPITKILTCLTPS